ncbi:MAG: Uma2 family endonuclease [Bryobacteraceae bacterium]
MAVKTLLRVEEYDRLPDNPGVRYELRHGELVEMAKPRLVHNRVVAEIFFWLKAFSHQHPGFGEAISPENEFIVGSPDNILVPDAAFIRASRISQIDPRQRIPGAPDLAIEVLSPSQSYEETRLKAKEYLADGCQVVWIFLPETREVHVAAKDALMRILTTADTLSCPDLLPGFSVAVSEIFGV